MIDATDRPKTGAVVSSYDVIPDLRRGQPDADKRYRKSRPVAVDTVGPVTSVGSDAETAQPIVDIR